LPCLGVGNGKLKLPCLGVGNNGTACLKKCKKLFEYQHLLLLSDNWWLKF